MMLFSSARDPVEVPAASQPGDLGVELGAVLLHPLDQLSRERLRVVERLGGRPAGHLLLVEGEDRGAALVGAAHSRLAVTLRRARRTRRCGCRPGPGRPR